MLSLEVYSKQLEEQIAHDKKLAAYLRQVGDQSKAQMVEERIKIIEDELEG